MTVKLGDSGDIRESSIDTFQYVPLLSGLRSLLQNRFIFDEVLIYVHANTLLEMQYSSISLTYRYAVHTNEMMNSFLIFVMETYSSLMSSFRTIQMHSS